MVKKIPEMPEKSIEERLDGSDLKEIIGERLRNNGVKIPFEYAVKEKGEFILMSQNFFNQHSDFYRSVTWSVVFCRLVIAQFDHHHFVGVVFRILYRSHR